MTNEYIRVPYGSTVHGEEEIEAVVNVLNTTTQMGIHVAAFETEIAKTFSKKYGVMTNSGSSALYLALEALKLPKDSEVITPALTFSTTVGCLVKNELVPSFVDVEEDTYCIDIDAVKNKINKKTKAILAPDLLGNLCDWKALRELADEHGLLLLHDSADTLGATIDGVPTGSYTDLSITSFYGSHIINGAGNGGMVCINNEDLYEKIKLLRSWGRSSSLFQESESIENRFNVFIDEIRYDAKFVFSEIGYQLEPSEISAAFGLVQLKKLDDNLRRRREIFNQHSDFLENYKNIFLLPKELMGAYTGWLAYPIQVYEDASFTRTDLQIFLEKRNIQTRVIFTGNILRQPGFKDIRCNGIADDFVNADKVMKRGMLLGCHHGLNQDQINHIHESIELFLD